MTELEHDDPHTPDCPACQLAEIRADTPRAVTDPSARRRRLARLPGRVYEALIRRVRLK